MKQNHIIPILLFSISIILGACSTALISKDKYVEAMVALGCKDLQEGNSAASEVLKQLGTSEEQIVTFRKKSDFQTMADAANEIATRVIACHGVDQ
ncbi:MAG: hypothetical protein COV45_01155 [Deltaproteobacteria bacterium CG11_big_fil_rev_8_21_14_0_20_47_16]|nr:MAG: hypothetical protein COV45_01155 [Deltaproteobacteria bacterium CG11_big_fil_rev_8_21_14_0_20_47_16]